MSCEVITFEYDEDESREVDVLLSMLPDTSKLLFCVYEDDLDRILKLGIDFTIEEITRDIDFIETLWRKDIPWIWIWICLLDRESYIKFIKDHWVGYMAVVVDSQKSVIEYDAVIYGEENIAVEDGIKKGFFIEKRNE